MSFDNSFKLLILSAQLEGLKKDNEKLQLMLQEIIAGDDSRMAVSYAGTSFKMTDGQRDEFEKLKQTLGISGAEAERVLNASMSRSVKEKGKTSVLTGNQCKSFIEIILANNNSEIEKLKREHSDLLSQMQATTKA